jgi:Kelch motif
VLVAGGDNRDGGYLDSAELYDPANGTWTATDGLVTARDEHTATLLLSGQVLVAAGYGRGFNTLASAELYDANEQGSFLIPDEWSTTIFKSGPLLGIAWPCLAFLSANGIPSEAEYLVVPP